jgi:uncharacterized integral membrane protein (TIGR00698 family)
MTTPPTSRTTPDSGSRTPNALERALFGRPVSALPALAPGLLLAAAVVAVSVLLADVVNASLGYKGLLSYIMTAIVVGLVVGNTVPMPAAVGPGVSFCLAKVLRLGIIMMGIRLSLFDAARIGAWGIPIVLTCILTGLVLTTFFTRMLKLSDRLGTLMAVGTSICGASAIVATAPAIEAEDEEVAYAVANITVFGIAAMLIYPYLAHALFSGNVVMAGLFQGTAIHETAQVTGSALIYDQTFGVSQKPSAADVAIVIKLVRNAFMAVVIPVMAYIYARRQAGRDGGAASVSARKLFPMFILAFVGMAAVRSMGDAGPRGGGLAFGVWPKAEWSAAVAWIGNAAGYVLAMAMAGVGLGTRLKTLKGLGITPFYVGLFASMVVGVASAVAVFLLGGLIAF